MPKAEHAAQVEYAKKAAALKADSEAKSKLKVLDRVAARPRRPRARRVARGKTSHADDDGDGGGERIPTSAKERLISRPELLDRVNLTFPSVWKLMRAGEFPRSRLIGGHVVWLESEIDEYIASLPLQRYKGDAGKAVAL
jgi:predicted DNA-binding transcriptional regulator AlpA